MQQLKRVPVVVACESCGKEFVYTRVDRKGASKRFCNSCNVSRARKNLKLQAVAYKGGECQRCGYKKCIAALEFHHRDPSQKSFDLGTRGLTRGWGEIKEELDKTDLLCANCHREVEEEIHSGIS